MNSRTRPLPILILKLIGVGLGVLLAGYLWLADLVHHRVDGAIVRNRRFLRTCLVLYGELILCERVDDDGTIDWRTSAFCGTKALTAIARSPQEMKMAADERG